MTEEQMHANQIKQMSGSELTAYCGTDAGKWAQAFVALHGGDEGLMIGWFANAMETVRQIDARKRKDDPTG